MGRPTIVAAAFEHLDARVLSGSAILGGEPCAA